jgi:hypothetical protein
MADGTATFEDAPPRSYGGKPAGRADLQACPIAIAGVEVNADQVLTCVKFLLW